MTVEDWATAQMVKHGREWTQVQVRTHGNTERARRAMAAVRRGEYPKPRAAVAEAKAKVWEAEAQRRAAALQQQQAQVTMQNTTLDRETAGIVMHKRLWARDRERMATHRKEGAMREQRAAQEQLAKQQRAAQAEADNARMKSASDQTLGQEVR